jgi:hypothetical protein
MHRALSLRLGRMVLVHNLWGMARSIIRSLMAVCLRWAPATAPDCSGESTIVRFSGKDRPLRGWRFRGFSETLSTRARE